MGTAYLSWFVTTGFIKNILRLLIIVSFQFDHWGDLRVNAIKFIIKLIVFVSEMFISKCKDEVESQSWWPSKGIERKKEDILYKVFKRKKFE